MCVNRIATYDKERALQKKLVRFSTYGGKNKLKIKFILVSYLYNLIVCGANN